MKKLLCTLLLTSAAGCYGYSIGSRFPADPRQVLKVGHDKVNDVLAKMGQPQRKFLDSQGHEVFTYFWADGSGGGQKAIIGFNDVGAVYVIEVFP